MGYLAAIAALALLAGGWLAVQRAWGRAFDFEPDDDVLALRRTCDNCGCGGGSCRRESR